MDSLLEHVREEGGSISDAVEVRGQAGDRAVFATKNVSKGDILLQIPMELCFVSRSKEDDALLPTRLLRARTQGSGDDWTQSIFTVDLPSSAKAHVESMPTSFDCTFCWSEDELEVLGERSESFVTATALRDQMLAELETQNLADEFSHEDWLWAQAAVMSRGMDCVDEESNQFRVVPPVADMLNHSWEHNATHGFHPPSDSIAVVATRDIAANEEVCICYGVSQKQLHLARMALLYGFTEVEASCGLFVSMSPDTPQREQRMNVIEALDINPEMHRVTMSDPLPVKLMQCLRIQRAPESLVQEWVSEKSGAGEVDAASETLAKGEMLDPALEETVLGALIGAFEALLEEMPGFTDVTDIKVESRQTMASQILDGERAVLQNALEVAEELKSKLELKVTHDAVELATDNVQVD
jgi:hypothetical protein